MKTTTKHFTRALLMLSAAPLCLIGTHASAQVSPEATGTASPGRVNEQLDHELFSPQVGPKIEVNNLILQEVPPGAENIKLGLNAITFEGLTKYSVNDLQSAYADKLGQTITLADVYAITTALTNKYRNDGYILTQVIVPPQTIEGGVVKLRVVEGYVDQISVEGDEQESALNLIRDYANNIRTGEALNVEELTKYLLFINDLPGVDARSILSPSKTQVGAADLRIIVTRDPYDALISLDNFGSRYLGPVQLTGAASLNSYFGNNERITAQFVMAPDDNRSHELAYGSITYEQPINNKGTKVELIGTITDTEPGFDLERFHVRGRSQFMSASVIHPYIRSRTENLSVYGTLDWRDLVSYNDIQVTTEDRIRALRAGVNYDFLETGFLGTAYNAVNFELAQGLNILGATEEGRANITRQNADPQFFKATAELQRLQRISSDINLLVAAKGQLSKAPLLSSEEFSVGGTGYGRAYDPSEIIGDDGVAGKIELQWNEPYKTGLQDYQLYGFYDIGRIWDQDSATLTGKSESLASSGIGIRADFTEETEAGLAIAFPLTRDVDTQGDDDPRIYFNVSHRF